MGGKRKPTRDGKGRFLPGSPGGPGRRPVRLEEGYLDAIRRALPPEKLEKLVERLLKRAMKDDDDATGMLLRILVKLLPTPDDLQVDARIEDLENRLDENERAAKAS